MIDSIFDWSFKIFIGCYFVAGWIAIGWWEHPPLAFLITNAIISLAFFVFLITGLVKIIQYLRGPADA